MLKSSHRWEDGARYEREGSQLISHSKNVYVMPFDFEARGQGVAIDNFLGRSCDRCRFHQIGDRRKDLYIIIFLRCARKMIVKKQGAFRSVAQRSGEALRQ